MATRRRLLTAAVLAVVVIVAVVLIVGNRNGSDQPEIRTLAVTRGTVVETVSGSGVLKPVTTVEVKSNVGGQIVELAVDEGDAVKAGQLIARIDPSDSRTSLKQAQAEHEGSLARLRQAKQQADVQPELTSNAIKQAESSLASAEATLHQTETALIPQKLASAQASYDQAKASCDQAEKHLARQKALLEQGFVPRSQMESAEEQYAVAQAQLGTARSRMDTVKAETDEDLKAAQARVREAEAALESAKANAYQIQVKREDIVQAQADLERAEAAVDNARTQLGYTDIYAPRSGVVVKKYVEAGSIITAGRASFSGTGAGVAIVEIADVNRMLAEVDVDETDIAQIRVGQSVKVIVDAYQEETFEGVVTKIAPQAVEDQSITVVPVTVEMAGSDRRLKPGMNATCDFIIARKEDVLLVPNQAVMETGRGATVAVMEGGTQVSRPVETGISDDENTEIVSGLREGETVVTSAPPVPDQGSSAPRRMRRGPHPPF